MLNNALEMVSCNYPAGLNEDDSLKSMSDAIENFFLTDHCMEEDAPKKTPAFTGSVTTPKKYTTPGKKHRKKLTQGSGIFGEIGGALFGKDDKEKKKEEVSFSSPPVVPRSKKQRRSVVVRAADEEMLQSSANLTVGDEGDAKSASAPAVVTPNTSVVSDFFANNPSAVAVLVAVMLGVLRRAQFETVTIDSDYAMLVSFAFFCFGLNWPRPKSVVAQKALAAPLAGRRRSVAGTAARRKTVVAGNAAGPARLLRASMMMSPTMADAAKSVREMDAADLIDEDEGEAIQSPMETYPEGAPLGEYFNCVSEPALHRFSCPWEQLLSRQSQGSIRAFSLSDSWCRSIPDR